MTPTQHGGVGVLQATDCAVILTDRSALDYAMVVAHSPLIVDSRNVLKTFSSHSDRPAIGETRCHVE